MRQFLISFFVLLITASSAVAQEKKVHMDVSLTAGTTGIGGEIGVQPLSWMGLRVGGDYMPRINIPRKYSLQVGSALIMHEYDANGKEIPTKFDKMAEFMEDLTGAKIDQHVKMNRRPVMNNFHILVDVYPLKNKKWHATAGLHIGGDDFITGENDINEAATMVAVSFYNNMYYHAIYNEPIAYGSKNFEIPNSMVTTFKEYGIVSVDLGNFTHDVCDENGKVIHSTGEKFYLEPDENCKISGDSKINRIRPYFGLGYMSRISKHLKGWKMGFDVGAMFWGGHPSVLTTRTEHITTTDPKSGKQTTTVNFYSIDLTSDVELNDKWVGTYKTLKREINFVKSLYFYPVLEFKLSYNIF